MTQSISEFVVARFRLILVLYVIIGGVGNVLLWIWRSDPVSAFAFGIFTVGFILTMAVVIGINLVKGDMPVAHWGFSTGKGFGVSLVLVVASASLLYFRGDVRLTGEWSIVMPHVAALGAFVEEVVFRVILIRLLLARFPEHKHGISCAVALSAFIFTLLHVPLHAPAMLFGIFVSSVLIGYVTTYTRSVLFGGWCHIIANTYDAGLMPGLVMTLMLYGVGYLLNSRRVARASVLSVVL